MPEYRCRDCGTETSASPFRTTCPECGGPLRSVEAGAPSGDSGS
ncbi:MAG: rubrerythrin-like domain-containing protein [Halobacteriales archaeon]